MTERFFSEPGPMETGNVWFFPTTKPFTGIVQDRFFEDLTPVTGFVKDNQGVSMICGVDLPSVRAAKIVKERAPRYNLLVPLLFPHVIAYQPEISTEIVFQTMRGIEYFLAGEMPDRQESARELLNAHAFTGRATAKLDPNLTDAVAGEAHVHQIPVDWEAFGHHVRQLEFSAPFIDLVTQR